MTPLRMENRLTVMTAVIASAMQSDQFTKSSHDDKLFYAWFGTFIAALMVCALLFADENLWLFWIVTLTLAVGVWVQYFVTKIWPRVWTIEIDQESLRYLLNGELIDELRRTETVGIRCYTSRWSMEGVRHLKLDLRNGGTHNVSVFRLAAEKQDEFLQSVERQWGLTAMNGVRSD